MKNVRKFFLPDYDTHFTKWFSITNENYQMRDLLHIFPHLKNYRIAIDAGACVGFHTRILETIFNQVYAFEPDERNFECLEMNVNPALMTSIHRIALSNQSSIMGYKRGTNNCGATRLSPEGNDGEVKVITLDSLGFTTVDFIKIDVEGMEKQVLEGANNTLRTCRPVVYVENSEYGSLDKFFYKLDYKRVYSRHLEEIYAPN